MVFGGTSSGNHLAQTWIAQEGVIDLVDSDIEMLEDDPQRPVQALPTTIKASSTPKPATPASSTPKPATPASSTPKPATPATAPCQETPKRAALGREPSPKSGEGRRGVKRTSEAREVMQRGEPALKAVKPLTMALRDGGQQMMVQMAVPPYHYYTWSMILKTRNKVEKLDLEATQQLAGGLSHVRSKLSSEVIRRMDDFEGTRGRDSWDRCRTEHDLDSLRAAFFNLRNELDLGGVAISRYQHQLVGRWPREPSRILLSYKMFKGTKDDNKALSVTISNLRRTVRSKDSEIEGLRKELLNLRQACKEKTPSLPATIQDHAVRTPITSALPAILPLLGLNVDPLGPRKWKVECGETQKATILAGLAAQYQLIRDMI
jgi:hypothetical protein